MARHEKVDNMSAAASHAERVALQKRALLSGKFATFFETDATGKFVTLTARETDGKELKPHRPKVRVINHAKLLTQVAWSSSEARVLHLQSQALDFTLVAAEDSSFSAHSVAWASPSALSFRSTWRRELGQHGKSLLAAVAHWQPKHRTCSLTRTRK